MNQLLAALMFFTRLPFWRIKEIPAECFKHVVPYWSLCGWLTGGVMALTCLLTDCFLPHDAAIILALASRLLLTGALHEDGLADFMDGFGGGRDRESTLRIMKDSHIGSYGVLGLIVYYLLAYTLLTSFPPRLAPLLLLCGDTWGKLVASHIINALPYARKEEESKAKTIYARMNTREILLSTIGGALPLIGLPPRYWMACTLPLLTFLLLIRLMKRRLNGYTGDCCGALFLLCELSFWIGVAICAYSA